MHSATALAILWWAWHVVNFRRKFLGFCPHLSHTAEGVGFGYLSKVAGHDSVGICLLFFCKMYETMTWNAGAFLVLLNLAAQPNTDRTQMQI